MWVEPLSPCKDYQDFVINDKQDISEVKSENYFTHTPYFTYVLKLHQY